jgi:tripartite-type tricarboxylate transporter receptor subunit TctC
MKETTMRNLIRGLAAGLALFAASAVFAQDYPTRPVKILVPYGPGTGIDLVARIVAERLSKSLNQSFVVENRTGAGGTIASAAVATAAPDGYTLLMNASSQTSLPALYKNLSFDGRRDFVGVAVVGTSPLVLVTSKAKGFATVKDLVAAGKAKPDALTFASAGVGTTTHLSAEKFRLAAGFQALHVPYKSTTDALAEVMTGRIDYLVTTLPSALGPVKDGRLVALAMGAKRAAALPNVPTLAEAGVPGAESDTWFGMFAPAKTPREVVVRLHAEVEKAVATPEVQERLARIGAEPVSMSLQDMDAMLKREFAENEQLVKTIGIKLE